MKNFIYVLALLVAIAMGFTACHSDDNDVEPTSHCYISSFKLGMVKRTIHTTSKTGEDSTITTTINASTLRMAIDHRAGTITNVDLLLQGSQLEKVPVTVSAQGSVVYASVADTSSWKVYSTKDSIDFTQPVIFRVLATDGKSYRDYTATLRVRENVADDYTWQRLEDNDGMKNMTAARLMSRVTTGADEGLYPLLFTSDADGQCYYGSPVVKKNNQSELLSVWWNFVPCEGLDADCDVTTVVSYRNRFWMSSASGKLFVAEAPRLWEEVAQPQAIHLVAASTTALYGAILADDGYTMATSTDGLSWMPMTVEGRGFKKPLAGVAYTQSNGNHRVLVLADAYDDATSAPLFAWSLLEGSGEAWLPFNDDNTVNALPRWKQPQLLTYNGWLMALGNNDRSGRYEATRILVSRDNGLNWKADSYLSVPMALRTVEGPITALAIGEYVWIIAGSQCWVLRYNSYGEGQ